MVMMGRCLCILSWLARRYYSSSFTTDGEFVAVAVEISDVYAVVKRTVNSATVYCLKV